MEPKASQNYKWMSKRIGVKYVNYDNSDENKYLNKLVNDTPQQNHLSDICI